MAHEFIKNGMKFVKRKKRDQLDWGFDVPGLTFRWVAARRVEDRLDDLWQTFSADKVPEAMLKEMKVAGLFYGGNTLRHNELVLAFCRDEDAKERRKELDLIAKEKMDQIYIKNHGGGVKTFEAEMHKHGANEQAFID
jgi:hypothetical protein